MKTGLLRRLARRRRDPLAAWEARLEAELAAIEEEIRSLKASRRPTETAARGGGRSEGTARVSRGAGFPSGAAAPRASSNVFGGGPARADRRDGPGGAAPGGVRRWLGGPKTPPPRWAPYLAAGSIQGLPTLRHERRVARNRRLLLVAVVLLIGLGLFRWWR